MKFDEFVKKRIVRRISVEEHFSRGLIKNAEYTISMIKDNIIDKKSSAYLFRNYYECLRMLLDAFLSKYGYKSYSHEAVIVFAHEKGLISLSEMAEIDRMRKLRHDNLYRGEIIQSQETKDAKEMYKLLYSKVKTYFLRKL